MALYKFRIIIIIIMCSRGLENVGTRCTLFSVF